MKKYDKVKPTTGNSKSTSSEISKAQIDLLQKSWSLILKHAPQAILKLEEWSGASSQDNKELIAVILGFGAQTGTTLEVLRLFLEEEFKKNSQKDETNQNTIMRGSVLVSKLIKEHLISNGQPFLKDLLSKFIQEMIESDDVSLEIDPLRIERGERIEDHVDLLLQKTKSLLTFIFGPGLQKIPTDICSIAAIFAEMAHHYAPEQIYVLVGGFLFLRFINPALLTPEQHGLVPEGKTISVTCRRNLTLVAKLIQNISNMVEVLGKEDYINRLNEFVLENRWNMENFFKMVIAKKSSTISVPNSTSLTPENYYYYNNLIHPRTEQIMAFATPQGIPFLSDCLEKLSQYVHLDNFLSKKYDREALATVQISISIDDQVFVQSFETSVNFLQGSFLKDNIKVLKKEEGKLVKKREKSTLNPKRPNQPDPAQVPIFGKPLPEVMEHQKKTFPNLNLKIPLWLDEAFKHLMLKAPFTHGIFRVSGDKNVCEQLKNDIDQHKSINLKKEDPHNIASLIKQFLRDIPGQLLGDQFSESIISATAATESDEKISKIKRALTTVPSHNRALLFRLMLLLWELDSSSYLHEMDAHNLSIVFGPTILKFNPLQLAMINEAVKELISHFSQIFSDDLALYENENIVNGPVWIQRIATPQSNKGIGFTANGEVWTSYPKAMRIWDAQTGQLIRKIDIGNHSGAILAVSAVGSYLICCTDQVIQKWDTQIQNPLLVRKEGAVDLSEVDDTIWAVAASVNPPNQIQIYDLDLNVHHTIDLRAENLILRIKSIGETVWMGCKNGTILIYDSHSRQRLHTLPKVHQGKINDFVETTNHVWSGGDDGILHVFKKDTFEEIQKIDTRVGKAKALGVFQNKVWVCNFEKSVKVYSSDTFKQVWEMKDQHDLDVIGIIHTWSKTRNCWLAWTASYDSTISWWKIPE